MAIDTDFKLGAWPFANQRQFFKLNKTVIGEINYPLKRAKFF